VRNASIESLLRWKKAGKLHPLSPRYLSLVEQLQKWARGGASWDSLFMAQAHLWGAWLPLVHMKHPAVESIGQRKKLLALALTEPGRGSDALNVGSTIFLSTAKGKKPTSVRLKKEWVTNGINGDVFVTILKGQPKGLDLKLCVIPESKQWRIKRLPPRWSMEETDAASVTLAGPLPKESYVSDEGSLFFRISMLHERAMIFCPVPAIVDRLLIGIEQEAKGKSRGGRKLTSIDSFQRRIENIRRENREFYARVKENAEKLQNEKLSFVDAGLSKVEFSRRAMKAAQDLVALAGKESLYREHPVGTFYRDMAAGMHFSGPTNLLEDIFDTSNFHVNRNS
jgi:alkylation response protein AidB-like acyl-CoA dehydrogenase